MIQRRKLVPPCTQSRKKWEWNRSRRQSRQIALGKVKKMRGGREQNAIGAPQRLKPCPPPQLGRKGNTRTPRTPGCVALRKTSEGVFSRRKDEYRGNRSGKPENETIARKGKTVSNQKTLSKALELALTQQQRGMKAKVLRTA